MAAEIALQAWGCFKVATIHGSMKPGSREEPGTRLHAEQQFREGAAQVLVATEAAGEGINLPSGNEARIFCGCRTRCPLSIRAAARRSGCFDGMLLAAK